jgi:5-(carboxyamino)imidazole ribonucleotide synthase
LTQHNTSIRVGIIGDGQLALMLAEACRKHGIDFRCLSRDLDSSVRNVFPEHCTSDPALFRSECQAFTLENEFHSVEELRDLLKEKSDQLFPRLESYQYFADKLSQRKLYEGLGLPSPRWMRLASYQQLFNLQGSFSYPFVVKASAGGYDGKGVRVVHTPAELERVVQEFGLHQGREIVVEELVPIKYELAQGFVRSADGRATLLPLVDTVQEEGVCNFVRYPSQAPPQVAQEIEAILQKLIARPLVGIFNFEFFVDHAGHVTINEGAPRPHNSQHLTIDASDFSQFELLALYLAGRTDLPPKLKTTPSVMVNLLGKTDGPEYRLELPSLPPHLVYHPKLYAKAVCRPGRKMGHLNIVDKSGHTDLLPLARRIFQEYEL